ncbi:MULTISPECIES: cobyrinate a,c-diamide synthase [Protofrankia]|uniref:Hydrogenobyrinate a,c-diamide synthase n=1 Tax=Candidatus Protofrankia datiscae TaxID=2716812 RepID=F8B0I8_9ACTN|nr:MULTISPECIES: cobyrinate a,c-diamide synthase [Protofrankia]AEH09737.1 Cobyrinic acid A,C-diamide synthase [Candidatus Protofrankia datiscae]
MVSGPGIVLPRLLIAAPASGAGKTTVATGLMAALTARGLRVSPHKVGPDYIDPSYHALATGRPGRNLDAVLCGEERIGPLLAHGAHGADIAVVEGVMGLFDGVSVPRPGQPADFASAAHAARLTATPVVLVVDASAAGRSAAAVVHGFATWDRRVRLAGVVFNRVGSAGHERLLRDAVAGLRIPVLGVLRRDDTAAVPSRHLGLVPAAERALAAAEAVRALGALVAASCDLDAVLALARSAPPLDVRPWTPSDAVAEATARRGGPAGRRPVRIAVAGGSAFTFGYAEQVELLRAAGAEIATVDPLRDEKLPDGTDGLVIGGGFPEEHAAALAANAPLRAEVVALARRGAPIVAECAGLLYLARSLDGHPMCGILDADTTMGPRLTLGYRQAVAVCDNPVVTAGTVVTAHEFHHTSVVTAAATVPAGDVPRPAWRVDDRTEGFVHGNVHASYLHLHWAGVPGAARRFVATAREARSSGPSAADVSAPAAAAAAPSAGRPAGGAR